MVRQRSFHALAPWLFGALLIGIVLGFASPATAQVLYGSVVGTITDQTDAVVPNASVSLINKETGVSRETLTDNSGRYSFVNVLPGHYDVKATAKGFRTLS